MYQIGIRGIDKEYNVQDDMYPFTEGGISYNQFVVVDDDGKPIEFLIVMPIDIHYRRYAYTEEAMKNITTMADAVQEQYDIEIAKAQEQTNGTAPNGIDGYHG